MEPRVRRSTDAALVVGSIAMLPNESHESEIAPETALEPGLSICDAHHHLWERPPRAYLLEDFQKDLISGHNIVSTVAVECGYGYRKEGPEKLRPVGEVEFLDKAGDRAAGASNIRVAAAIVDFADLSLGDGVAPVLEAHMAARPTRFRGIRYSTTWDASGALRSETPPGMLCDRKVRQGVARLNRLRLSFDVWVYHLQLSDAADLARAFPDLTIILDHLGAPLGVGPYAGKRDEVFQTWSGKIAELAGCPNVVVKLGGLGSLRSGHDWHRRTEKPSSEEVAEILRPYFERCIDQFGVQRCMFESNFPVEKAANSYVVVWNAFKRLTQGYSREERAALFHDTACRVYRIPAILRSA